MEDGSWGHMSHKTNATYHATPANAYTQFALSWPQENDISYLGQLEQEQAYITLWQMVQSS